MLDYLIRLISAYRAQHHGAYPTAIAVDDNAWYSLGADSRILPHVLETPNGPKVRGVPLRRVKALGIRVVD